MLFLQTQMERSEYYIVTDQSLVYFFCKETKQTWFYGLHGLCCNYLARCSGKATVADL